MHEPLLVDDDIWRLTVDAADAQVAVLDEHYDIIAANEPWRTFPSLDGGAPARVGDNFLAVCEAADQPLARFVADGVRDVASGDVEVFQCERPYRSPPHERWFGIRVARVAPGSRARVVVSYQDITELRLSQLRARAQSLLLDEVDVAVHATDLSRRVRSWNAGAERLFGWTPEEAIGRKADELILSEKAPIEPTIRKRIGLGRWEGDLVLARKDGSTFPAHVRSRVVKDLDGRGPSIVAVSIDITERLRFERDLELARDHLRAVTDSLGEGMFTIDTTGRVTYMNPVAEALLGWSAAEVYGKDLHRLTHKRCRDGSAQAVADCQIMQTCRGRATVDVDDDVFIRADGTELEVAYTTAPFSTAEEVEGCVIVFRDVSARNSERRNAERQDEKLDALRRIRVALEDDRFVLFAQPIVELGSGEVVQQELLIRMQDPDREGAVIPPGAFLPVAEEFGLVVEIDRWVIDQGIQLAAGGSPVELNVSGVSIGNPRLLRFITSAIQRYAADPRNLVFEITETTLVANELAAHRFVEGLHELGCRVALDDFGTGYGGFTYLKRLPVDIVKIDIEFVRDLTRNDASQKVVEAIVNLARRFELSTVAEGVEDEETLVRLRELGVDHAQGYHLGRPAPIEASTGGLSQG